MSVSKHNALAAASTAWLLPPRRALVIAALILLSAVGLLGKSAVASAAQGDGKPHPPGTPAVSATIIQHETEQASQTALVTATAAQGQSQAEALGWAAASLRDLAEVLGWPPVVASDGSDRLYIQRLTSEDQWSLAMVRQFDSRAGAEAAFTAEQQDAKLAGYAVTPGLFYSYPAYTATITDANGRLIEQRFHWLADSVIMGVDVHESSDGAPDPNAVATQLLALAVQYGMPDPPAGASPTPSVMPSATPGAVNCNTRFIDVTSEQWAYSYISDLACMGIVSGYSDATFRPQNSTTRGQLVKMVVLSEGWTTLNPTRPTFSDVGQDHTFYRYIETAYAHGVISGYADNTFRPDLFVSRSQVAKMLVLARNWELRVDSPAVLCDMQPGNWAWSYVQVAIAHGMFTGYGDGCFYPDAFATRAQLAKVLVLAYR